MKARLDSLVVARGWCESRETAQRWIMAARVRVDGHPATKPGHKVADDVSLDVRLPDRFVSRGGAKLEAAFTAFGVDVAGLTCLDVGASTGGFTDCLLQHGAARVVAVDVGRGQLHQRLRGDPRVRVREGLNARYLKPADVPEVPAFATLDVSFISLRLVLPPVLGVLAPAARLITLIKPQFEAGREAVGKGGVVRSSAARQAAVDAVVAYGAEVLGLRLLGLIASPVHGPAGNIESLAYWEHRKEET